MINVYCVLVKPLYDIKYVERLYLGVKQNLTLPFNMICLTDGEWKTDLPITFIDVRKYDLDIWWNKIAMLSNEISGPSFNLYFDLDVSIVGNIDFLLDDLTTEHLCVVDSVWKDEGYKNPKQFGKFGSAFYCYGNSSVLGWIGNSQHFLFDKLMDDIMITVEHYGDDTYLNKYANTKFFQQKICDYLSPESMYSMKDKRVLIHFKDPPT